MRNRIFFIGLFVSLGLELMALALFAMHRPDNLQDTVAVNEVLQTVESDWNFLENHHNHTAFDYVVLDDNGSILYKTKPGLSESINTAVRHKDTILDIEIEGRMVGKLIIYNHDALIFGREKETIIFIVIVVMLIQCGICAGFFLYMECTVVKPFRKLRSFAQRIADGNLDIPLKMDRQNIFGAFTESFDLMRSELKKARIAEARANADKKELVAKLSHDIKTPVASIKAAAEVGAALAEDEKNKGNYEQIIQKADQINRLVTNLFSSALEELSELSVTSADLKSEELRTLLENADYLHRAKLPAVPDCLLWADKLRLQQVFDNLFANSYKYANTEIDVKIYMEEKYLTVCMEDYGGGVNQGELPLLKEKFKRGSNTQKIEGAGLGLYISDYCMKKMRGELVIENGKAGLRVLVRIAFSSAI